MKNFYQMEVKFGGAAAYYCLLQIEQAAGIPSAAVAHLDPETRLVNALRAQDEIQKSSEPLPLAA